MSNTPSEILKQRGVYEAALRVGVTEGAKGWEYPIFDSAGNVITKRGKAYPDTETAKKMKYWWIPEKPENPDADYYIFEDTRQAIADAHGVAYLANGEASTWAFREAGIKNVFATLHSEMTIPKTLHSKLQELGITKLINIADKDKAGTQAAVKWRDALRDSDTEYSAKQWPDYLPEKSDFNDLWIHLHFDKEAVAIALEECEALILPQTAPKPLKAESSDKTPQGLIDSIASALGISEWKSDGFSRKNVHCLFHDDSSESAGFNRISGVFNCFAGCGAHSPKAVAEKLGIDWKAYYPKREGKKAREKRVKLEKPQVTEGYENFSYPAEMYEGMGYYPAALYRGWIDQDELPLSWVKALLHLCHSKSATPVYMIRFHRAIRRGKLNPKRFSIEDVMRVLGALDEDGLFRHAPRKSVQNFVDVATTWGFFRILATNLLDSIQATKSGKNSAAEEKRTGRPKIHYAIAEDTEALRFRLAELLEPMLLENLSGDELAPRTPAFRDALDLPLEEFKRWHERTNNPRHESIIRQIQQRVCEVLENDASFEFDNQDLVHPADLRGKLLRLQLVGYSEDKIHPDGTTTAKGIQLSRGYLAMELGCSESSMSKLYTENNVGVKRIKGWYEVENPNNCDIWAEMREAPMKLNKELGGMSVGIRMKVTRPYAKKAEYLPLAYYDGAIKQYEKWNGQIEKLYIYVEQPSLLWLMNAKEIEEKAAKEAEKEAAENEVVETGANEEKAPEIKEKKPRKKTFISNGDRVFVGLSESFKQEQLAREVYRFTPYTLSGLSIVDKEEKVIATLPSYKELVMWLNRNASEKPLRSDYSFNTGVEDMEKAEKPVVYYIRCELLNKTYIGKALDMQAQIKADFAALARKKHSCRALQAAYNEFGKDALSWGLVEDSEPDTLDFAQDYWIQKLVEEKPFSVFNPIETKG